MFAFVVTVAVVLSILVFAQELSFTNSSKPSKGALCYGRVQFTSYTSGNFD